jgi:hypothetical protein
MKQELNIAATFKTAEATMWQLVQRHTGRVGYRRGVKVEGLDANPPVIDCSGWVGLLLTQAMQAENEAAGRAVFGTNDVSAIRAWSDRIIMEIEARTGFILEAGEISATSLPRCATIGLKMGEPAWAMNHHRPRGITHVVQIVRRPEDDTAFVSESLGWSAPLGIRLTPLAHWLVRIQMRIQAHEAWAVDPFRMASNHRGESAASPFQ